MSESNSDLSRRTFLERLALGAGVAAGVSLAGSGLVSVARAGGVSPEEAAAEAAFDAGAFGDYQLEDDPAASVPASIANPNILIIMVDQLRAPYFWATVPQSAMIDTLAPNLANIRKNSVSFRNTFVAATACTPSRSALLTGLYAPQTAMFATLSGNGEPDLNTGFPTFGSALQIINQKYSGNLFWFGKWHLSNEGLLDGLGDQDTLPQYGFNASLATNLPNWPDLYGSPNGEAGNEGANGIFTPLGDQTISGCGGEVDVDNEANDNGIYYDFYNHWSAIAAIQNSWCAAVSFVNPHDMSGFPYFFPTPFGGFLTANIHQGLPFDCSSGDFYPANSNYATEVFTGLPSNWNYENVIVTKNLSVQNVFLNYQNTTLGSVSKILTVPSFLDYLNWYYFLLSKVDFQIGEVLNKVYGTNYPLSGGSLSFPLSTNTAVIFLSDHGDYAGSHGLRAKGGAVYDEGIRVPFYVILPNQPAGAIVRNQMVSLVDIFRFILELGNNGAISNWNIAPYNAFIDQSGRESIFNYCYLNTQEQYRMVNIQNVPTPYILTTMDELYSPACDLPGHIISMRLKSLGDTRSDSLNYYTGAKYGIYSKWVKHHAPNVDGSVTQQYEYYDYDYLQNRGEMGNDYSTTNASSQVVLNNMQTLLGNSPVTVSGGVTVNPGSGLIATELMKPLQTYNTMVAQNGAYNAYNIYIATNSLLKNCT